MSRDWGDIMTVRSVSFATALGALIVAIGVVTPRPAASAVKDLDTAGFIQRWLILEPIPVPPQLGEAAVQAVVKKAYFEGPLTLMPREGERVTALDEPLAWHAVDTRDYNVNLFHFAHALGKPTSNVLFWTVTGVDLPRELSGVRLAIGSNAASVWWLDGEEVIGLYNDRQTVIDDGVSKRVTLKKGVHVIRAAIVNGGGATDFCARFIDEDGNAVRGLTTRITAEAAPR